MLAASFPADHELDLVAPGDKGAFSLRAMDCRGTQERLASENKAERGRSPD